MSMELEMSPARKAWATRRAIAAVRESQRGTEAPSPLGDAKVVELNLADHHVVGSGFRRYVVLAVGFKWVRLFYVPKLVAITVDRITFDKHAKAMAFNKRTLARLIRDNIERAKQINATIDAETPKGKPPSHMSEGGKTAKEALSIIRE